MKDTALNNELFIMRELLEGKSIRYLSNKYKCSTKTIQKIKKDSRWYIDLTTKELVFTSKSISTEEQSFHLIYSEYKCDLSLLEQFLGNKTRRCLVDWRNKEIKLVGCDEYGNIDEGILEAKEEFIRAYGNVEQTQRKRKRTRGLYLLYQNDELHYIGMSNNVNFRLYQHSYGSHLVELQGEYDVKIIEVENYSDLRLLEEILIRLLKPNLNKEYVDDKEMGELFKQYLDMIPSGYSRKLYVK